MSTVSNSTLASRFKALVGVKAVPPPPTVNRLVDANKFESVKILVLGNSNVGKSQFIDRLCGSQPIGPFPAIGIDFRIKTFEVLGKKKKLQIWDMVRDQFQTLTMVYYRGAHAAILLYEVGDRQSFACLRNVIADLHRQASDNMKMILIGKCDNPQNRIVTPEEGKAFADEYGMSFLECEEAFDDSFVGLLQTVLFSEEFDEAAREAHEAREARKARGAAIVGALTSDRKEIISHWFKKDEVIVQPPMLIKDLANIVASYDEESIV